MELIDLSMLEQAGCLKPSKLNENNLSWTSLFIRGNISDPSAGFVRIIDQWLIRSVGFSVMVLNK